MKSISEILGSCQLLLDISYEIHDIFEGFVTDEHRTFIHVLRVVEDFFPKTEKVRASVGRKAYEELAMIRSCLA